MRRVASLYLPTLATDRLRRSDTMRGRQPDRTASPASIAILPLEEDDEFACSTPRDGGWRPGARWAQTCGAGAAMGDRAAEIAALPAHQRPSPRELGRRSEAADHPFKAMKPDEIGGRGRGAEEVARPGAVSPIVTTRRDRQKIVIAAADPAARALGLQPGMAVTHARALVPDLEVREADPGADAAWLHRLALFALRHWTPTAMVDGEDGLLLDLTGVAHLHGGEVVMARRIVRFLGRLGVDARIAISGSVGASHALARHGRDRICVCATNAEPEMLSILPVAALRPQDRQRDAARRLGIETIGDLLAMPRAPLARRFGASLLLRLDQAIGRVAEPIDALIPYVVPVEEIRFTEPIGGAEGIAGAMAELASRLAATLLERGLGARAIRLVCDRVDGAEQVVAIGMARGTRDVAHMLRLLAMKVETIDPGFGIDAMRLIAVVTEPLGPVAVDSDLSGETKARDVSILVDQIVARIGLRAIFRPSAVESDVPERSVRRIAPLSEPAAWSTLWPRPIRVLRRPEPIDGVIALLPDQPPRRFTWRGTAHVVKCADGPERVVGEWWKRTAEAYSVRDYFRLENERGERFWVFRRGDGEDARTGDMTWHMAGFFG